MCLANPSWPSTDIFLFRRTGDRTTSHMRAHGTNELEPLLVRFRKLGWENLILGYVFISPGPEIPL